jgi:hypothetical protein
LYDETQPAPATESDTDNKTKFHPDDANHDTDKRLDGTATFEQHYARLASHNTGIYNGKWADKTKLRSQDNLAVFDAIAGQLELTRFQKTVGRDAYDGLNLRELSSPGGADHTLIAIMVAAVVSGRDGRPFHPNSRDGNNDALIVGLINSFDYPDSVVHSTFGKIRHRLEDDR